MKSAVLGRILTMALLGFFLADPPSEARMLSSQLNRLQLHLATKRKATKYLPHVTARLEPLFKLKEVTFPPHRIALLSFKDKRILELWARDKNQPWRFIKAYPLTAYSGHLGPKLRYHDYQIPEGIYHIVVLNPFSSQHLSMKLNYPNSFDYVHAHQEGRANLGGDIFIHGKASSVGCLAIGNTAIEELFVLTYLVGVHHTQVIIAPNDMRYSPALRGFRRHPHWIAELDQQLRRALQPFRS